MNQILPHQERVLVEKVELDLKMDSLGKFFETTLYDALTTAERGRLQRQFAAMQVYSKILGERIAAF